MPTQFQRSLVGGEISPALIPRMDQSKRSTGFEYGINWYLARTGVAYNRPGWQFVALVKDSAKDFSLKTFDFDDDEAYCLEFGDYYVRFHVDGTPLVTASVSAWVSQGYAIGDLVTKGLKTWYCCATHTTARDPETAAYQSVFWYELSGNATNAIFEVPSPYPEGVVPVVEKNQSGDVTTLTHRGYPPHELVRTGQTAWTLRPKRYAPEVAAPTALTNDIALGDYGSPFSNYHPVYIVTAVSDAGESLPGTMTAGAGAVGTIDDMGAAADLIVADTAHGLDDEEGILIKITEVVCTDATNESNDAAVQALKNRVFRTENHPTDAANKFILQDTAGLLTLPGWYAGTWPPLTVSYARVELVPTQDALLTGNKAKLPDNTDGKQIRLQWTAAAGAKQYFVYKKRTTEKGNFGAEAAGDYGLIGKTDKLQYEDRGDKAADPEQPPPLHPPPFVAGTWPAASTYHQQRETYARSDDGPNDVTMSVTGDFQNFTERFPIKASDRVKFTLAGQQVNEIRYIISWGAFLLFTRGGVYVVQGDANGVISPTDINTRLQDGTGVGTVRPEILGDTILYVTRQQTRVKDLRYSLQTETYRGDDLTAYAPHLFRGHTIIEWAYAENPDSIVYAVRDDGVLLMLTYVREHEIWSWTQAETAIGGLVKRVCVAPEGNEDRLYLGVEYTINGSVVKVVCRQARRTAGDDNHDPFGGQRFLDAYKDYDGTNLKADLVTVNDTIELTLTGISYSEGETGLALVSDTAGTFPGDDGGAGDNAGNGYRLLLANGDYVECIVEAGGDTDDQNQVVTLLTDCPAGLQGVAVTAWCRMANEFSGYDHLEGESVGIHADGHDLGDDTVTGGAISDLARPYGKVSVGLRNTAQLKLLPIDLLNQNDDIADKTKTVNGATLWLVATRGLQAGLNVAGLQNLEWVDPDDGDDDLVTGQRDVTFDSDVTRDGGILIQQTACLAAGVSAVMTHYVLGDR